MYTSRRGVLATLGIMVAVVGGMFFSGTRVQAEDSHAFSVTASVLAVDGTPNTTPTRFVMTTDFTDGKSRDMYDIYRENVTSSFVINQSNGTNPGSTHVPIRAMVYWVCPIDAPVIPASPLVATSVPPLCQQVDFRAQTSFTLTFQYRAPNKILHGRVTDENGNPLASSSIRDSLFYVFATRQSTTPYYSSGDRYYTWTDASGNYLMAIGDTGGTYRVGVSPTSKDYLQVPGSTQDVTFANDTTVENQEVNFVVPKAGSSVIQGRVVDKHGQPLIGFSDKAIIAVYAYQTMAPFAGSYMTPGADGKFSLKLVAGTYNLFFSYLPLKGDGDRINYPTQLVTVADGQTMDIGDVFPQKEVVLNPSQTSTPPLVSVNNNERIVAQSGKAKSARFTDSFSTQSYINSAQTNGVKWANGALSMDAVSASSSSLHLSGLVSMQTVVANAIIVSKPVTPKYLDVKSVTLVSTQTVSGTGKINYSISPNGTDWLTIVPGMATTLPTNWDTTKGLRWRATMQRSSSSDTVSLSDVQLIYTYQAQHAAPRVTSVGIKRQGTTMKLTIRGKNLSSGAALYIGGRKVVTTVKNGVLTATIQRSTFPKRTYQVTVVNPDLQYSTTAKINVLVAR